MSTRRAFFELFKTCLSTRSATCRTVWLMRQIPPSSGRSRPVMTSSHIEPSLRNSRCSVRCDGLMSAPCSPVDRTFLCTTRPSPPRHISHTHLFIFLRFHLPLHTWTLRSGSINIPHNIPHNTQVDGDDGVGPTAVWSVVSLSHEGSQDPARRGWVIEQLDGDKRLQQYKEVIEEDPPTVCTCAQSLFPLFVYLFCLIITVILSPSVENIDLAGTSQFFVVVDGQRYFRIFSMMFTLIYTFTYAYGSRHIAVLCRGRWAKVCVLRGGCRGPPRGRERRHDHDWYVFPVGTAAWPPVQVLCRVPRRRGGRGHCDIGWVGFPHTS